MTYTYLLQTYHLICKQTGEPKKYIPDYGELFNEVNRLLVLYDCLPLSINDFKP